jgi:hypothetical protein
MAWTNYLDLYFLSAGHRRIEVVNPKPQKDAIPMRPILVADWTVIVFHIPAVQL